MQKNTLLLIGIVLLVLGVIGLITNFSVFLMWALVILGVVGILIGWFAKGKSEEKGGEKK